MHRSRCITNECHAAISHVFAVDTKIWYDANQGGVLMKAKHFVLCAAVIFLAIILIVFGIRNNHTFTLSNAEGRIKSEQIQPLWGSVRVSGDSDTNVVFTDVETGEEFTIGYITHGVTEKIKLEKGKWYTAVGAGSLTISPVNVRVE